MISSNMIGQEKTKTKYFDREGLGLLKRLAYAAATWSGENSEQFKEISQKYKMC